MLPISDYKGRNTFSKLQETERYDIRYPTSNGLTEDDVFNWCTRILVNSTIAKECGGYFDRDIMLSLDICVLDVTIRDNPDLAILALNLIEAQCEESLRKNLGLNSEIPSNLKGLFQSLDNEELIQKSSSKNFKIKMLIIDYFL